MWLATRAMVILTAVGLAGGLTAADWPQWRGPQRDGKSAETGLLEKWPTGGPPLSWKITGLGEGFSSLAVANGKIFTQGQRGGQHYVIALDEATGRKLWEVAYGPSYSNRRGNGPRGTPTIDGDRLYAIGANGYIVCLNTQTGKTLWEIDFFKTLGARNISWGLSESPLVDGNRLIVNPGARGASIVALDKMSGKMLWKSQSDEAGYSSAMPVETGGVRQYVVLTGEAAVGLQASTGELLWRYDKVSNRTANIATPIISGNHVFVSTDYGTGCALLELSNSGGKVNAKEVYFNREMRNHYSTSVLLDGILYGYSSAILTAMDLKTGDVKWRDRSVGKGQIIYADGKLYLFSENGVAGLAEATPAGYREISRFDIGKDEYPTWTLPVIANGHFYLRDQDRLMRYRIAK